MKKKHYKKLQRTFIILAAIAPSAYLAAYIVSYIFILGLYPDHIVLEMKRERFLHPYALLEIGSVVNYFIVSCIYAKSWLFFFSMAERRFSAVKHLNVNNASYITIFIAALINTVLQHHLVLAFDELNGLVEFILSLISVVLLLMFDGKVADEGKFFDFKYPVIAILVLCLLTQFFYRGQHDRERFRNAKLCTKETDESCDLLCLELDDGNTIKTAYFDRLADNTIIVRGGQFELIDNNRIKGRKVCKKPSKKQN